MRLTVERNISSTSDACAEAIVEFTTRLSLAPFPSASSKEIAIVADEYRPMSASPAMVRTWSVGPRKFGHRNANRVRDCLAVRKTAAVVRERPLRDDRVPRDDEEPTVPGRPAPARVMASESAPLDPTEGTTGHRLLRVWAVSTVVLFSLCALWSIATPIGAEQRRTGPVDQGCLGGPRAGRGSISEPGVGRPAQPG